MKIYTDKHSGEVLVRNKRDHSSERLEFYLYRKSRSEQVGRIYFQIDQAHSELAVFAVRVTGHSNAATARNPTPGVGRLLMYMACRHAQKRGVRTIRLTADPSAVGFYRQIGLHHPSAPVPRLPGEPFIDGNIQPEWLSAFNRHLIQVRRGGMMVSELRTVLWYIERPTLNQWDEGREERCVIL
jgi:hypothetical protein